MFPHRCQQNWLSWEAWNTDEDKVEAIKETVHTLLEKLATQGLDRERLEACFNSFAFKLRDRDGGWAPRSLAEALTMLDSWLYGGDPAQYLQVEKTLEELEAKLSTDYYAKLLRELFLDNPHKALTILVPSRTLGDEKRKKEADRVAAESGAWTEADKARIQEEGKTLTAWQQAPDSPEALATIPMLQLSDIDPTPEKLPVTVMEQAGIPVLLHKTGSSLVYLDLHFDVSDLTLEELRDAALLTRLLGKLPTAKLEEYRLMGELINANLWQLKKGQSEAVLQNFYDEEGGMITVPLDIQLTPVQNAQRYFKKYQKARTERPALLQEVSEGPHHPGNGC